MSQLFFLVTDLFVESILLDGGFVSIFEKLNEDGEREMREGVLAQSIPPLALANESILKLLALLVKMVKTISNIKHSNHKNQY